MGYDFIENMNMMFEGALSATEAAEVAKLLERFQNSSNMSPFEVSLGLGGVLATMNPESTKYKATQRILKAALRGMGHRFMEPIKLYLSEENLDEGSALFKDMEAVDKMSNFELLYNINEHYRQQREARFNARYEGRLARFNAVGTKGKGKKAGAKGGASGFVKVGEYTDEETGKVIPMIYELTADSVIGERPAGRDGKTPLILEDLIDANGIKRPASAMYYTRANQDRFLDKEVEVVTKVNGKIKRNKFTLRELHEKITLAQEQWERENNRMAVFSDGREAMPDNTEVHIDEGSFTLMPLPCDYPVGTDYNGNQGYVPEMAATVTVSGIPEGQRAVITVSTEPVGPQKALPSAEDARKAKPVQVQPNGKGNPYQGLQCTKCNKGVQTNSIKPYAPKITMDDPRVRNILASNLIWEAYEVCSKCRASLEQEVQKKEAGFRKALATEKKLFDYMEELIKLEDAYSSALENAKQQETSIANMKRDKYNDNVIKTVADGLAQFRTNTLGPLKKKVQDSSSTLVQMEKSMNTQFSELGVPVENKTTTTNAAANDTTKPVINPNKARVIKNADGSDPKPEEETPVNDVVEAVAGSKAVTKPAANFNTMGNALANHGIKKDLTRRERRAAERAAKAKKNNSYRR